MSRGRFIYMLIVLAGFVLILFVIIAIAHGCDPSPSPPTPEPTTEPTTPHEDTLPDTGGVR